MTDPTEPAEDTPEAVEVPGGTASEPAVAADDLSDDVDELELNPTTSQPRKVFVGGEAPLTVAEGFQLMAERECRVVLVAGDANAGKTTLLVELWARFLTGAFRGRRFAGSRTLEAFSRMHASARASSGLDAAVTPRTPHEAPQFLHLRLEEAGRLADYLLTDVRGEYFEQVVDGEISGGDVELAARADLCIVVLNGDSMESGAGLQETLFRAQHLLGGLLMPGGLRDSVPILLVCTKADLLDANRRPTVDAELAKLAERIGDRITATLLVSTRGDDREYIEESLGQILERLTAAQAGRPEATPVEHSDGRYFWRRTTDALKAGES